MVEVSAVIPTYNRPEYIGGAIETVLDQTYDDIEVIVVNDGTDERAQAILDTYEAKNDWVRVINNDERGTINAARNQGTAAARGRFICVLDDDDRWHPEKVEKQVEAMAHLDDRYAVVYTWGKNCTPDGEVRHVFRPNRTGDIYPEILGSYGLLPHSGHMLRKECLEAIGGYDSDFRNAGDWDACIRLAKEYRFACLSEVLVMRTVHDHNVSGGIAHAEGCRQLLEKHREDVRQHLNLENKLEAHWRQKMSLVALERRNRTDAKLYSWAALGLEPTAYRVQLALLASIGPRAYEAARWLKRAVTGCT